MLDGDACFSAGGELLVRPIERGRQSAMHASEFHRVKDPVVLSATRRQPSGLERCTGKRVCVMIVVWKQGGGPDGVVLQPLRGAIAYLRATLPACP